jgi:hypothetical protein
LGFGNEVAVRNQINATILQESARVTGGQQHKLGFARRGEGAQRTQRAVAITGMGDQFPSALRNAANQRVQPTPVEKAGEDDTDGAVGGGEALRLDDAAKLGPALHRMLGPDSRVGKNPVVRQDHPHYR